jgi:protein-tyrosine phosphatase
MAEAIFRHQIQQRGVADHYEIDSAGTGSWHIGDLADPRTRATLAKNGIADPSRARQVSRRDYSHFDEIIVMDDANWRDVMRDAPEARKAKITRLMDWHPQPTRSDVPDPYYGGPEGFDQIFRQITEASSALLDSLEGKRAELSD